MSDARRLRWTFTDRVTEFFAPGAARRRMADRLAIETMRRGYDAATKGRGTAGWRTSATSADAEIKAAGGLLRDRMRDLVRNNALAAQAVQVLVNNLVGAGIVPRAKTGNADLDKRINAAFDLWSNSADAAGHTTFYGLQALAVREMVEGGDVFALRRQVGARQSGPSRVPLRIELREADHLDAAKFDSLATGGRISTGIEYDAAGRRVAYWMFDDHPGDSAVLLNRRYESRRIAAETVAHLFERQRTQSRGVPWGAPAMRAMRELGDWQEAELVRKRTEAALVGVVLGEDDADGAGGINPAPGETATAAGDTELTDAAGNLVEEFAPGMFAYLRNGRDIRFNQPSPAGGVAEWNRVQMHLIAAGFRVPYALMTGDMSQANFSATRAGLNEFRRMVETVQWGTIIPMFCAPVWSWWEHNARIAGLIPEGVAVTVEWQPPRFESVNPLQDVQADILETRAGFTSPAAQIARRGWDADEVMADWAAFAAAADAAGLVFDTDPRKLARSGLVQTTDPTGTAGPAPDAG